MKPTVIIGIMALATAAAVLLHARKTKIAPPAAATKTRGLGQILTSLPPEQSVSVHASGVPGEVFFYVRLALAPRHVSLYDSGLPSDTVLYISANGQTDSVLNGYASIRQMIIIDDLNYQLLVKHR